MFQTHSKTLYVELSNFILFLTSYKEHWAILLILIVVNILQGLLTYGHVDKDFNHLLNLIRWVQGTHFIVERCHTHLTIHLAYGDIFGFGNIFVLLNIGGFQSHFRPSYI